VAHLVLERACRDALFLGRYDVAWWPLLLAGTAVIGIALLPIAVRWTALGSAAAALPPLLVASAVLSVAATLLMLFGSKDASVVLVVLQSECASPLVLAAFAAWVGERLGPRSVRRPLERVAWPGLFGCALGWLAAERLARSGNVAVVLPWLAAMHATAALAVGAARGRPAPPPGDRVDVAPRDSTGGGAAATLLGGWQVLRQHPHLRDLGAVVLLAALGAVPIDYVLKARVAADSPDPSAWFALFARVHAGAFALGSLAWIGLARPWLARVGLASAALAWPAGVAAGGALLLWPATWAAAGARALEASLLASLHRAGRELLTTPVRMEQRGVVAALVEGGAGRAGVLLGCAGVAALAALPLGLAALAIVAGCAAVILGRRLQPGYLRALEEGLARRAVQVDDDAIQDRTTRLAVQALRAVDLRRAWQHSSVALRLDAATLAALRAAAAAGRGAAAPGPAAEAPPPPAAAPRRREDLLAADPVQVRAALHRSSLARHDVVRVLPLLGRDEFAGEVIEALRNVAIQATGLLVDVLLDPEEPMAVRRRVPRVLVASPTPRSVEGLLRGLDDPAFEIRSQCARALARLHTEHPQLVIERSRVLASVRAEARGAGAGADPSVDDGDERGDSPHDQPPAGGAGRRLEQVFTLLSLVLPPEPVRLAFAALHTDEEALRSTALDYLDEALPLDVRAALAPWLEPTGKRPPV
jgi:hypothetical protein